MRRITTLIGTAVLAAGILGVPSAATAAAGDFGNACTATTGPGNTTGVMISKGAANALPIAAPLTGVITGVTMSIPAISPNAYVQVKTARPTGNPNEYAIIAQSTSFLVSMGTTTYPVRVPVTAGDLLASGGAGTLMCATADAGDVVALVSGTPAAGTSAVFTPTANRALSMVATVEPDVDKDGYGDTTQDLCPQLAAYQTACPTVKVTSFTTPDGKKLAVLVATSNSGSVAVAGVAKVKGKQVKLNGGTQSVGPGDLARFTVKLPKALKSALAGLSPSKRITVTITATATDLIGRVTTHTSKIKVPGTKH